MSTSPELTLAETRIGLVDRVCRKLVTNRLRRLQDAALTITFADGSREVFGDPGASLQGRLIIRDESVWRMLLLRGNLGAGEGFAEGLWSSVDPALVVRAFVRNREVLEGIDSGLTRLSRPLLRAFHFVRRNTRRGSRRNISAHYDLGNEFFELFLDPTMMYSSGVFEGPHSTMEQASLRKIDALFDLLALESEDRLLEIGTGWGALAERAAASRGCRVDTTTISSEQARAARARIEGAGLAERVNVHEKDYRDLEGTYDKLVSVEMVEAVGHQYLEGYLAKCAGLLAPDGLFAMQAITIADQIYDRALAGVDFIKRYIFPGSFIPSTTALLQAARNSTDFRLVRLDDYGAHYAKTLRIWREALHDRWQDARDLGYSQEFLRRWEWYLAYCEGGFAEGTLSVVQLLFRKEGRGSRPTSGYDPTPFGAHRS